MNETTNGREDTWTVSLTIQIFLEIIVFTGNLLMILVIRLKKSLYENNTLRIVLSLSITDLFLALTVLPFTIYIQLNFENWNLGFLPCAIWLCCDLQLKTTSIYHLCSITYERYLSIAKPMLFRINIKKRILYFITFNWTASFLCITLPFIILINFDTKTVYKNTNCCSISSSYFIAYTTVVTFWIPLVIMMFFGSKAVYLIRKLDKSHLKMNSKLSSLADMTPRNSFMVSESSKDSRENKGLKSCSSTEILNKDLGANRPRSNSLNLIYKRKKLDKNKFKLKNIPTINVLDTNGEITCSSPNSTPENFKLLSNSNLAYLNLSKSREESQISDDSNSAIKTTNNIVRRTSRLSTIRLSIFGNPIRKELKAQKTLTIALIVFLLSYFPFFTFLTIMAFKDLIANRNFTLLEMMKFKNEQDGHFMRYMYYSTTWLAYSSAAINPILQFLLNNNLKNSLKSTLCKNK
ncbi:unnamed protein product [Brachionus calyciflorus]|uniref:G-protein coupled receptors family 1 profile domain-containing protein n=1 Tax=Brachionus calyciflorus TaxID=104777 RepID=A0A813W5E5_9BILA|nr:unnamed protein product [Brachionus calyciflorus]